MYSQHVVINLKPVLTSYLENVFMFQIERNSGSILLAVLFPGKFIVLKLYIIVFRYVLLELV